MTPTPEMEAFAREIATKHFGTSGNGLMIRLMSVAIREVIAEMPDEIEICRIMKGAGRKRPDMARAVADSFRKAIKGRNP